MCNNTGSCWCCHRTHDKELGAAALGAGFAGAHVVAVGTVHVVFTCSANIQPYKGLVNI
jgi:hypothetical protein